MSANPARESRTHTVVGMTCDHCVRSVTEEVSEVAGVTGVEVDLTSGRVVVTGEDVSDAAVAAAVEEAGYTLVREGQPASGPGAGARTADRIR